MPSERAPIREYVPIVPSARFGTATPGKFVVISSPRCLFSLALHSFPLDLYAV
jgi:hypothetical protein